MEDFTKFKLKSRETLTELFESRDNFTFLACKKCFKEFTLGEEPECEELVSLLKSLDKTVSACYKVDFLCNKYRTTELLDSLDIQGTLVVVSCGLGVQTVGGLTDLPVFTACDSVRSGQGDGSSVFSTNAVYTAGQMNRPPVRTLPNHMP